MADHRRSPQVMFYATGLGHEDIDTFDPYLDIYVKEKTTWKMRTLESLLRQHNHTEVGVGDSENCNYVGRSGEF